MLIERDKIISDYDSYIDKLLEEKEQMKGMEGLVRKLETEKEFLENEIEKVRAIKMMLENQLNAYSDNAEIRRLKENNEKQRKELLRFKKAIMEELGFEGDINKVEINQVITTVKREFISMKETINTMNNAPKKDDGEFLLRKRNEELEDQLRFTTNDFTAQLKQQNAEMSKLRSMMETLRQENANLQRAKLETFHGDQDATRVLKVQLESIKKQHQHLINEHESLKRTVAASDGVNRGNGGYGGQAGQGGADGSNTSSHTKEVIILQQKIKQLESADTGRMNQEIENLRQELAISIDKINRLQSRNNQLEARTQELANAQFSGGNVDNELMNQYQRVMQQNRQLELRNNQLEDEINNARRNYQEQNRNMAEITQNQYINQTYLSNTNHAGSNQGRGAMSTNQGQGGNYRGTGGDGETDMTFISTNARANITSQQTPSDKKTISTTVTRRETVLEDGSSYGRQTDERQINRQQPAFDGNTQNVSHTTIVNRTIVVDNPYTTNQGQGGQGQGGYQGGQGQGGYQGVQNQGGQGQAGQGGQGQGGYQGVQNHGGQGQGGHQGGFNPDGDFSQPRGSGELDDAQIQDLINSGTYSRSDLNFVRIWSGRTIKQEDLALARRISSGQYNDADLEQAASRSQGRIRAQDIRLISKWNCSDIQLEDLEAARRINDGQPSQADIARVQTRSNGRINEQSLTQIRREINITTIDDRRQIHQEREGDRADPSVSVSRGNFSEQEMNLARLWGGPQAQQSDFLLARRISSGQYNDADLEQAASRSQGRIRAQDIRLISSWGSTELTPADLETVRRLNDGNYTEEDIRRASARSGGRFNEANFIEFNKHISSQQGQFNQHPNQTEINNQASTATFANNVQNSNTNWGNDYKEGEEHIPQWGHEIHLQRTGQILSGVSKVSSAFNNQAKNTEEIKIEGVRHNLKQEANTRTLSSGMSFAETQPSQIRTVSNTIEEPANPNRPPSFGGSPTNQGMTTITEHVENVQNPSNPTNMDVRYSSTSNEAVSKPRVSHGSAGQPSANPDIGGLHAQGDLQSARHSGMYASMTSTSTILHLEKIIRQMSSQPQQGSNDVLLRELTSAVQAMKEQEINKSSMRNSVEINGSISQAADRAKKMEILVQKKQRQIDDLLMRIFLVAAENDRLKNDDQLARNIEIVRENQAIRKGMQTEEYPNTGNRMSGNSTAFELINRVIPGPGFPDRDPTAYETRERSASPNFNQVYANFLSRPSLHGNQVFRHAADNQHLTAKLKRKTEDVDAIIKDIYDRHGLNYAKQQTRYSTPERSALMKRLGVLDGKAGSHDTSRYGERTELETYFAEVNPKVIPEKEKKEIQHRLRVEEVPERIRNREVLDSAQSSDSNRFMQKLGENPPPFVQSLPPVSNVKIGSPQPVDSDPDRFAQKSTNLLSQPPQPVLDPFKRNSPSSPNRLNPNRVMFTSASNKPEVKPEDKPQVKPDVRPEAKLSETETQEPAK